MLNSPSQTGKSHRLTCMLKQLPSLFIRCMPLVLLGSVLFLMPGKAQAWWNDQWSYRKPITVDGGATGAALSGNTGRMPVLVRLHDGNFKFSDAADNGADIRFVGSDDKTPLKYHIERYDPVFGLAFIWVDVPDVKAGASSSIWLYYGNPKAATGEDAKGTYDSDQVLVYHFSQKDGAPRDVSAYANSASTAPLSYDDAGLIGGSARFDGSKPVVISASPSLAIAPGGALTWSAWVKPSAIDGNQIIFARHDGDNALVVGIDNGAPYVLVRSAGGAPVRTPAVTPFQAGQWHQIAFAAADKITLYVDGKPVQSAATTLPQLGGNLFLGADAAPSVAAQSVPAPPAATTANGFRGEIDEFDISKSARAEGYFQARFGDESGTPNLLHYGPDEEASSWSSGYLIVILKSVTLDGWVVIGLLMVMAVISWLVMFDRARYVGRTLKGNRALLAAFDTLGRDRGGLEQLAAKPPREQNGRKIDLSRSSLHRILCAGISELHIGVLNNEIPIFSPQRAGAVKASLDAAVVEETQALNRFMVLLTIAISGGPFLGLLGTVIGVMVTFAAIAAAGDVNVNAIAPGIAAALAATVAGLFVAIPALFAYNYLSTRINNASDQLVIFSDRLAARAAELYPSDLPSKYAAE